MKKLMKKLYQIRNLTPLMAVALVVTVVAEQAVAAPASFFAWGEPDAPSHLLKK